jgi:GNAT superfamily N-acetyltransferase
MELLVRPVVAADAPGLAALFQRAECACSCQYWTFSGDHRDWQLRLATEPEENGRLLRLQLDEQTTLGVVALVGSGAVIGWSRLAPATELTKLYAGRLYKGLPCFEGDRAHVMTIGCVLVDPAERRRGVARALIAGQLAHARFLGARAVEAFPRGAVDVSDGEQWMGPAAIYRELGFEVVHDFPPYPVFRKDL